MILNKALMTSRERLLAAIRHEEPDRVPIVPRYHSYSMRHYGDHLVENQFKMCTEYNWDLYIVVPSLTESFWPNYAYDVRLEDFSALEQEGVKTEIVRKEYSDYWILERKFYTPAGKLNDKIKFPKPDSGYGIRPDAHFLEHLVKDAGDLQRIRYLLLDPYKYSDFSSLHRARKLTGNNGLIMAYTNSPFDNRVGCVYGSENFMMSYYDDRQFCTDLLELFQEHSLREIESFLAQGVDGIHATWFWSSISAGWSPKMIEELFLPLAKEQIDLVHKGEGLYYYYDDGKLMDIAEKLKGIGIDILGTCVPPPIGDVDLGVLKKTIGDTVCLHGNTDVVELMRNGTPDMIRKNVEQCMADASCGGGFIMGTSDSLRADTPEKNIRIWTEAALKFGAYSKLKA